MQVKGLRFIHSTMESIIAKRKFIINSKFKIQNSKFSAYFSNTLSYPTGGLPSPPFGVSGNDVFDFFLFSSKSMQNRRYLISVLVKLNAKTGVTLFSFSSKSVQNTRYGCKITKKMVNNKVHIFRVWIKSVKLAPK